MVWQTKAIFNSKKLGKNQEREKPILVHPKMSSGLQRLEWTSNKYWWTERDFKGKLWEVRKDHYIIGIPIKLTQYNRLTCSRWIKFHMRNNFLLSKYNPMSNYVTLLSNADTVNLLPSSPISCIENENSVQIVENYVTLIVEGNTNTWYIATCTKKNEDDTCEMDHPHKEDNLLWFEAETFSKGNFKPEPIVECDIDGELEVSKERNMACTLLNHT